MLNENVDTMHVLLNTIFPSGPLPLNSFIDSDTFCKSYTVEPLSNDHPHQRPSLSYDHISCDGQWFLVVYESLTSDHPYDSEGGRIRGVLLYIF